MDDWLIFGGMALLVLGGLIVIFVAVTRSEKKSANRRMARQVQEAQWLEQYNAWWNAHALIAMDPNAPVERLRELAMAPTPNDPVLVVAQLELLRMLVRNPSTPTELHSGILTRISNEEIAIRTNQQLSLLQSQIASSRQSGSTYYAGTGFSVPMEGPE